MLYIIYYYPKACFVRGAIVYFHCLAFLYGPAKTLRVRYVRTAAIFLPIHVQNKQRYCTTHTSPKYTKKTSHTPSISTPKYTFPQRLVY